MNRAALLTAMEPVTGLTEITRPKNGNTEFVAKEDGLWLRPSGIDDEYKVGKDTAAQALTHVPGLSKAAIKEWPVDLLLEAINWWYQNGDGEYRILTNGQNEVVSFTKRADHGLHSPVHMIEAIEEALAEKGVDPESFYYDKVRVGLDKVSFAVVTSDRTEEAKVGDALQAGIMGFMSPTGASYTELSPYVLRLVCTNGMVSPINLERWAVRGNDGGSIYDWTKEMTFGAWDAIDGELEALRALTEVTVPDESIHTVLADLFDRHHVNAGLRQAVTEAAVIEADGTLYGLAQAFNRAANDREDVGELRHLLMVTGDVAHQTERCTTCLRSMN